MPETLRQVVRRLAATPDHRTDAGLVADFLRTADQDAFAELVRRHGPMVLGVCRRFLGPSPDADDAFQATFLVLVRRSRRTVWRKSLGPWLYGVAVRVARKALVARSRRRASERQVPEMAHEPATPAREPDDLAAVLDEELAALPEKFRRPLVLCELQGASRKDAARELGLAEGTLSSRLARGRRILRDRLARRGLAPSAVALTASVPAGLASATCRHAAAVLARAVGAVPAGILSLTEGVVKAMVVNWKLAAVALAVGVGLTGFGAWNGATRPAATAADPQPTASPAPTAANSNPPAAPAGSPRLGPIPIALDFAFPIESKPPFNFYIGLFDSGQPKAPEQRTPAEVPTIHNLTWTYRPVDPVATIFDDVAVTREMFVEHLVRRYGKKDLGVFVNRQIIEHAFRKKGFTLSEDEVRAAFEADIKAINVTRDQFERDVLPKYGKTMVEWLDDVIIPRLMLAKMCKARVAAPTEQELRRTFDAKYGEQLDCRVIVWPKGREDQARAVYDQVRASDQGFRSAAAGVENMIVITQGGMPMRFPRTPPPGNENPVYPVASILKPGEVSPLVETPGGLVVIKCDKVISADTSKSFDAEKPMLLKEVLEAKITREIPKLFDELKRQANPRYHVTFPDAVVLPNSAPKE
jgi:RNA polymerase sigma factor (sigma-70 family)